MNQAVLIGSGGCMRELVWQIQELNKLTPTWEILGYIDEKLPENGRGVVVGKEMITYLGNDDYLLGKTEDTNVFICVGPPLLRKKIADRLMQNPNLHFPNLILSNTRICEYVQMGKGCMISMDAAISTNVTLGDFVFLNLRSSISHDGRIGDFVTLSPDVTLAGNVTVGNFCELGLGTKIIQGIWIGGHTVTGAGSVVVQDIAGNCTIMGVPAKERDRR